MLRDPVSASGISAHGKQSGNDALILGRTHRCEALAHDKAPFLLGKDANVLVESIPNKVISRFLGGPLSTLR